MSDFVKDSIKNHLQDYGRIMFCHGLGITLGWAAFPLVVMIFARYNTIDRPLSIITVLATIAYAFILVCTANESGLKDRKPYKWLRYKGKGFVTGALVGLTIFLLELLMVAIANKYFTVYHPQFDIENVNNYVRMILYMPFFWFYNLVSKNGNIIPRVSIWGALAVIPFISIFSGLGYLLGSHGIVVEFKFKRNKK